MIASHPTQAGPTDGLLLIFLLAVAVHDARTRKIPNLWTYPTMLVGIGLAAWQGGSVAAGASLAGLAMGFCVLFPPWVLGGVAAGDVKFLMAIGALSGWRFLIPACAVSGLALGLQALGTTLWRARDFGGLTPYLLLRAQELKAKVPREKQTTAIWIPYGVGIAFGVAAAWASCWRPLG